MKTEKTYTGTSPSKIRLRTKNILWICAAWFAFILWLFLESSFIPIIILTVFIAISLLLRTSFFQRKIYIKVAGGALSVRTRNAVLWKTLLQDITSIELEESTPAISAASGKALLIRNNKNDSYYLPLDGITFEGLEPTGLVDELNEIRKNA